jgi:hypothetical protein
VDVDDQISEERQPDGPLVGVKYGAVVSVDGVLRFESTTRRAQHSRCYDVESIAICQLGMDHRVPAWSCTCGFYAMKDREALLESWGEARLSHWAVLTVELYGRVIEHERGWRSARQTVVEAAWEDHCHRCGQARATGFGFVKDRPGPLVPLCPECGGKALLTVSEVSGRLGTDVRLVPSTGPEPGSSLDPARVRRRWRRDLFRRVAALSACGLAVAGVISAASHGSAQPVAGLPETLAPLVNVRDPQLTARYVADHFDGPERSATVLADPVARSGAASGPVVGAIAVVQQTSSAPGPRCRIVIVDGRSNPDTWDTLNGTSTDLPGCTAEAVKLRSPVPVSASTPESATSESTSPAPASPAPTTSAPTSPASTSPAPTSSAPAPSAPASTAAPSTPRSQERTRSG